MPKKEGKKLTGRNFALTIILGIFVAIMVISLFNLVVSYAYEGPKYEDYCDDSKIVVPVVKGVDMSNNLTYCTEMNGTWRQGYCDFYYECQQNFEKDSMKYNGDIFFVYAAIGFILIAAGLLINTLLIQLITLPAGAFLVIEAAVRNLDKKLYVIITFTLLIIAAVYLALKKLR